MLPSSFSFSSLFEILHISLAFFLLALQLNLSRDFLLFPEIFSVSN